jgi:hypothetical protein
MIDSQRSEDSSHGLELQRMSDLPPGTHNWLIENLLVRDEPMLIGGSFKSLKTSLTLDLAISLAGKTAFPGVNESVASRLSPPLLPQSGFPLPPTKSRLLSTLGKAAR